MSLCDLRLGWLQARRQGTGPTAGRSAHWRRGRWRRRDEHSGLSMSGSHGRAACRSSAGFRSAVPRGWRTCDGDRAAGGPLDLPSRLTSRQTLSSTLSLIGPLRPWKSHTPFAGRGKASITRRASTTQPDGSGSRLGVSELDPQATDVGPPHTDNLAFATPGQEQQRDDGDRDPLFGDRTVAPCKQCAAPRRVSSGSLK